MTTSKLGGPFASRRRWDVTRRVTVCVVSLGVTLALAVTPASAHEETPYDEYLGTVLAAVETWQDPVSFAAARENAAVTAEAIRAALLDTVPHECYHGSYVAMWVLYAALLSVAASDAAGFAVAMDHNVASINSAGAAMLADACYDP